MLKDEVLGNRVKFYLSEIEIHVKSIENKHNIKFPDDIKEKITIIKNKEITENNVIDVVNETINLMEEAEHFCRIIIFQPKKLN